MKGDYGLDYEGLKIIGSLPLSRFAPEGGENLLATMVGATIVGIGSTEEEGIEGGGLIIDYRPRNSTELRRAVFAFSEAGMWIEWEGPIPA